jgi:hypothetical protein
MSIYFIGVYGVEGQLNGLGSWFTKQLIQAYHQYGMGSRPGFVNYKNCALNSQRK